MTGLAVPSWVVVLAALAAVGLIVWQLATWWAHARAEEAKWKHLTGVFPFAYQGVVSEKLLTAAVDHAFEALVTHGPWSKSALWAALSNVRIVVHSEEAWIGLVCDSIGQCVEGKVGGQAQVELHSVSVGPSLSGLCHELAHIAEFKIERTVDYAHATWNVRGIFNAIDAYTA